MYLPSHILASGPQLIKMIFTLTILLQNGILAVFMNWYIGLFFTMAAYSFSRRFFDRKTSLLAACILISVPVFNYFFIEGKPTLGIHFLGAAAAFLFMKYLEDLDVRNVVLSGIFAGLALASSIYSGLIVLAMLITALVLNTSKKEKRAKTIKGLLIFGILAAIISSPFYIRSLILTGNPVFPFFYTFFGGKNWNLQLHEYLKALYAHSYSIYSFLKYMLVTYNFGPNDRMLTPIFLIFIPFIFIIKRRPEYIKRILMFTFIYLVIFYYFSGLMRRYSLVIFPFLSFLTAYSISNLLKNRAVYKIITFIFLMMFLVYDLMFSFACFIPRIQVVFKKEPADVYLSKYYDFYDTMKFVNNNTPASSKILLIWAYGYYCERESLRGDEQQGLIQYDLLKTPEQLAARFKALGLDYVLLNRNCIILNKDAQGMAIEKQRMVYENINKAKERYLKLVYSKNNADLYSIDYARLKEASN
jgi:hypothetical protein